MQTLPEGFPLQPFDASGHSLSAGCSVLILTVESCVRDLPIEDQERLRAVVGGRRKIVGFDRYGFVWLCFNALGNDLDFCLFPSEVELAG